MKRISALLLAIVTALGCTSCKSSPKEVEEPTMQPELSQMQAICDLAVMDCYYHNVAKYKEEDAAGALWWQKDKHFWIEYSGVVKLGVDVSAVDLEINGTEVTITLPLWMQTAPSPSSSLVQSPSRRLRRRRTTSMRTRPPTH